MTMPNMGTPPTPSPGLTKRQRLAQVHSDLKTERSTFISHWKQINEVLFPRRGRFTITDANKGDRRNRSIIDSTATFAARNAAAGLMTGTTNPARDWFLLSTPDPELADRPRVKDWLYQTTEILRALLLKSNFYDVIHVVYGDMLVYGTSPFICEEDDEDVVRFEPFPIGSYCLANDHKRRVRTFTREFEPTAEQLVRWFGWNYVSETVQAAWRTNNRTARFPIVHVVQQNDEYDITKMRSKYKPFYSCYFEQGSPGADGSTLLREAGYDDFPIYAARWDVTAEDVYSTECPGMIALGDILQLQFGAKTGMKALDKSVNPPLVAPPELMSKPISGLPGGITYDQGVSSGHGIRPLHEVRPDLDKLMAHQIGLRDLIKQAFFADVFMMTTYLSEVAGKQPRTAAEIAVREQEKLTVLGPVLQRLDRDVYDPVINRVFSIAYSRGLIPTPPEELQDTDLKVEYISILHAAQKAAGLGQMERFLTFATTVAVAVAEDAGGALIKVDTDEMIDQYHKMSGVPPRVVRSDEEVAQMRADKEKQQQAAQQAETLKTAAQGAQHLSQTDTEGKNALTDLVAAGGQ